MGERHLIRQDTMDNTSEPGKGTDPLEADFEQELAKQGLELEGRELPKPAIPAAQPKPDLDADKAKVDADAKAEADKKALDEAAKKKAEDGKNDPKNESWRRAVASKHQAKDQAKDEELERLRKENEELKQPKDPKAPLNPKEPIKLEEKATISEEQKSLAEKYGIEPEDFVKLFPSKEVVKEVIKSGLSDEQKALLDTLQTERQERAISDGFRNEFEKDVLPLIKAEYPNISDEKVGEIKSKIFEKIQIEQYSMTPLSTLYKGEDDFRGVVTIPKKTFDEGSKVPSNSGKQVYDFESVTDADIKNPDFPFEKYSAYMESKEKGAKRN